MVAPLAGFFQTLVPVARPMKLATVSGVSFSNSVQRILPAVVSKMATGSPEDAGLAADLRGAFLLACEYIANEMQINQTIIKSFRIQHS